MIRFFLLRIFNLFDHGVIAVIVIDLDVYSVIHLMSDDRLSQRRLNTDQPVQGAAPDGGHQPINFCLVILLNIELYRIVDPEEMTGR